MTLRALALAFVLFAAGCVAGEPTPAGAQGAAVPRSRAEIQLSFAPVVKQAAPAVVNIYAAKLVERQVSPFASDPFFRHFFGDLLPGLPGRQRIENSLGSGVILDPSGIVVSNHHVVSGADEIRVVLSDRREFSGRVIFDDEGSDLAVLQLEGARGLPALALRDSDTVEVGDLVLAIGNPFGVGQTVTSGIVSGLARSGTGKRLSEGYFIQTDAAINPGNSGGALVDMEGRLVGINTAILSRSGGSNGIGFAVPANLVARVLAAAGAGEQELDRPWFGLRGQPVTGEIAGALGLAQPRGVLIDELHPESPLARAGIEAGDVLTGFDGARVDSLSELAFRAATRGTGGQAEIGYLRRGEERRAGVRLIAAPEDPPRDRTEWRRGPLAGLTGIAVNPGVIEDYGLPLASRGVLVLGVRDRARRVGLRPGDILVALEGRAVESPGGLDRLLRQAGRGAGLEVVRQGRRGVVAIAP